ncbi:hypothetical protein NEOLEDRAFT_1116696 [Neolentinus lepideus HHB14362 ss-1]|uniref:Uncharacterized protein n=1 Tax=Neolentinus lepideus HHB14362 ss-1 TaxID=1314782 RepID=A0A165RS28_9AGAM|nr:hypothetical protein NEOLEDRAFT_1116696 [Neolentinus lepideus HHB14362 ss-1]
MGGGRGRRCMGGVTGPGRERGDTARMRGGGRGRRLDENEMLGIMISGRESESEIDGGGRIVRRGRRRAVDDGQGAEAQLLSVSSSRRICIFLNVWVFNFRLPGGTRLVWFLSRWSAGGPSSVAKSCCASSS